jgi:hypothetical protein
MRFRVIPYRQGSRSAKVLADALNGKVLKLQGSSYTPRADDLLINWGNTKLSGPPSIRVLNPSNVIRQASNKLLFFGHMKASGHEDIIPEFWTTPADIPDDRFPIVCRTILAGHSGDGIVLAADRGQLVDAPLYVKYIPKKDEYRVHVGKQESYEPTGPVEGTAIIAVQRKARRNDTPDASVNWQVRNHCNGFVFVRGDVNPPADVLGAARLALLATGLDFGAVDVIWNEKKGKAYVLEVNTAPGLEGQTVTDYASFFKSL